MFGRFEWDVSLYLAFSLTSMSQMSRFLVSDSHHFRLFLVQFELVVKVHDLWALQDHNLGMLPRESHNATMLSLSPEAVAAQEAAEKEAAAAAAADVATKAEKVVFFWVLL